MPFGPAPTLRDNGSAFNGRLRTGPRWNHKDRSARPVRCSAGLAGMAGPPQRDHKFARACRVQSERNPIITLRRNSDANIAEEGNVAS